ncbi:MAG TPA: hypothetical protein VJP07_07705 [Dehalococcoidia bacterium]|nr:hypothetical protein [Dehalococcoidia bacterium]
MDFANFAGIEFVQAIEAEREHDREQKKWLFLWQDLRRAADGRRGALETSTAPKPDRSPRRAA